ncbi:MAG: metalloregulator ArsR/SmtB family transcription factor [bacterium]|nr:metalloregulator ArsR/SmtB family transcription factor [bacterium]
MATQFQHPAAFYQAVGDPTRLRLLRLLGRGELTVQDMVQILGLSQPGVSKHLAVLREAGWLSHRKDGTWGWYGLADRSALGDDEGLRDAVLASAARVPEAAGDDEALRRVLADRDRRTGEFFAGIAGAWDQIRPAFEAPDIQAGAVAALVPPGLAVLDIGTGTGAMLPLLAGAGATVTAVDTSEAMLERARLLCGREGIAGVEFRRADIQDLPFADGSFDAAYCSMVLHHVARPERAVSEMARVVRGGGKVVIAAFTRHNLQWMREELAHQWLGFSREEVQSLFARHGLVPRRYLVRRPAQIDLARVSLPPGLQDRGAVWPDVFLAVGEKPPAAAAPSVTDDAGSDPR